MQKQDFTAAAGWGGAKFLNISFATVIIFIMNLVCKKFVHQNNPKPLSLFRQNEN